MSLINCEIILILTWFNKLLLLSSATEGTEFAINKNKTLCSCCNFIN